MNKLEFKTYLGLAEYIIGSFEYLESVAVAMYYEEAAMLLKELCKFGNVELTDIELMSPDCCGYDEEYYLILYTLDDDDKIYLGVSKAKGEKSYLICDSQLGLLHEDVHYAIAQESNCHKYYEIVVDEEFDDEYLDDEEEEIDEAEEFINEFIDFICSYF